MIYSKKTYQRFADELIDMGVSPLVVSVGDLVRLVVEAESSQVSSFNTNNLVAGDDGELIRINTKTGFVEVYNAIQDGHFIIKLFDIETGSYEGETGVATSWTRSLELYGEDKYYELISKEMRDFSACQREFAKDNDDLLISNRELANTLAREKIFSLGIKEKLLAIVHKYCKTSDYANEPISEIIYNISNALNKRAKRVPFITSELTAETDEIISRKLYLIRLNEEADAYSKISELPMMSLIEEYKSFHAPVTDERAKRCIKLSKKIRSVVDPFCRFRVDVKNHQKDPEDIRQMNNKHYMMLLQRRNELDSTGV